MEVFRIFGTIFLKGGDKVKQELDGIDKKAKAIGEDFSLSAVRAGTALMNIGDASARVGKKLTRNITLPLVAAGALMLKTYSDTDGKLADVFENLTDRLTEANDTIIDSLMPTIEKAVSKEGFIGRAITKVEELATAFAGLSTEEQNSRLKMIGFALALGPALQFFGNIAKVLGMITTAIGWLTGTQGFASLSAALSSGSLLAAIKGFGLAFGPVAAFAVAFLAAMEGIAKFFQNNPDLLPTTSKVVSDAQQEAFNAIQTKPLDDRYGGTSDVPMFIDKTKLIIPPQPPKPDDLELAAGGVATRPTRAIVGEAGDEAIIPLDRLPSMLGNAGGMGGHYTMDINVTVTGGELDRGELTRVAKAGLLETLAQSMRIDNDRYAYAMSERRLFR